MTPRQLAILNSLITFAAENIPEGLSDDEKEVAQIVGDWVLSNASRRNNYHYVDASRTHNYKVINASSRKNAEEAANFWAELGWRVVGAIGARGPGYGDRLILERPVGLTHPDD